MKTSTKDQVEGTFHEIKGKIKEVAGELSDNPTLEGDGLGKKITGKVYIKRRNSMLDSEKGKIGWILLWLLGIPLPILLVLYFLRGCT